MEAAAAVAATARAMIGRAGGGGGSIRDGVGEESGAMVKTDFRGGLQ